MGQSFAPRLNPSMHHLNILETTGLHDRPHELALPGDALDEGKPDRGAHDGQREAGQPGPGADVDNPAGGADRRELERHQGVGQVVGQDPLRIPPRRRSPRILGQECRQLGQPPDRDSVKTVTRGQAEDGRRL